MWHWKRTWEPLQISIIRGPQPKGRGFMQMQIFFKTNSSSKEALSKVLKPPSSTLEVYKEQSSVGSSLNAPLKFFKQHFEDKSKVLFKASYHQRISWRYKFSSRQALQARKLSLQARKLSQKFSSLLHLRLKSIKNEALLDQAKMPHKSSSTTLWRQIKGTHQSIKSPKGFREIQISFKTSSTSKEALALSLSSSKEALSKSSQTSFIYAWSLQRTKLCWIKPKRPIRVLQQHFEDKSKVLFKASNHQISLSSVGSSLNAP